MNWIVRVYDGEIIMTWWLIKNRTEAEADAEAMADIEKFYNGEAPSGGDYSWTMVNKDS